MKNCVYRFLNENGEIIYIGKAKDLKQRLKSHSHLPEECYKERVVTQYISFDTEDDMDFAERYFVPKEKPKYNTIYKYRNLNINIKVLDCTNWNLYDKYAINDGIERLLINDIRKYQSDNETKKNDNQLRLYKIKNEIYKNIEKTKTKLIINAETGEVFKNMQDAAMKNGISLENVYDIIEHGKFYKYKHPKYFDTSLRLMYVEVFEEKYNANPTLFDDKIEKNTKKVIYLKNNTVYSNIYEVSHKFNVTCLYVLKSCMKAKKYKNDGNINFQFAWYDDYKRMNLIVIQK